MLRVLAVHFVWDSQVEGDFIASPLPLDGAAATIWALRLCELVVVNAHNVQTLLNYLKVSTSCCVIVHD